MLPLKSTCDFSRCSGSRVLCLRAGSAEKLAGAAMSFLSLAASPPLLVVVCLFLGSACSLAFVGGGVGSFSFGLSWGVRVRK